MISGAPPTPDSARGAPHLRDHPKESALVETLGVTGLHATTSTSHRGNPEATVRALVEETPAEPRGSNCKEDAWSNIQSPGNRLSAASLRPRSRRRLPQSGHRPEPRQNQSQSNQPTGDAQQNDLPLAAGREDDSEVENDGNADNYAMDGMVEYVASSTDVEGEDSFNASSTFTFAMKIRASALTKHPSSLDARPSVSGPVACELAVPDNGPAHALFGARSTVDSSSPTSTTKEAQAQTDNLEALKLYLNCSYLQYVPQRMVAKALVDRYFSFVHPVWPLLIEEPTRRKVDQTWSSDEPPEPLWMAQLNLIFALACQLYNSEADAPLPEIYGAAEQHYLRGHGFVLAHAFNTCNVAMLQLLLLVAQYQQGTMRANECWLTISHATRMALGLGFHSSSRSSHKLGRLEVDLRKRLWWGCFSLDRFGLPLSIILRSRSLTSSTGFPA